MCGVGAILEAGTSGSAPRNAALPRFHRRGRAIWRRWTGTHRRSLIEARMRRCKRLDEPIMARDFDAQIAELQIRAFLGSLEPVAFTRSLLNRCTGRGTPPTRRTIQV